MALLPIKLPLDLMQTRWKSILDPWLKNPLSSASILSNITLNNGVTVINHGLGRIQQGWSLVDVNGAATIYRSAVFNDLTLTLTSNAKVIVSLEVF